MIKIAICDDDANITGSIERNIQKISTENKYEVETEVWQSPSKMCSDFKYWGKPDLLFLDIEFTDTNGMRVARYLRNELNDCYTSIVFISGKANMLLIYAEWNLLIFLSNQLALNELEMSFRHISENTSGIMRYLNSLRKEFTIAHIIKK